MFVLKVLVRNFKFLNVSRNFQYTQIATLSKCSSLLSKNHSAELSPVKRVVKKRRISSSSEEETKTTQKDSPPSKNIK